MRNSCVSMNRTDVPPETIYKAILKTLVISENELNVTLFAADTVFSQKLLKCTSTDNGELSHALVLPYSGLALLHLCNIH